MDIPTPPASSIAPSTHPNPLPQPRKHPLRPGGPKESELISYLDRVLDAVRYKVRHKSWDGAGRRSAQKDKDKGNGEGKGEGYKAFSEAAKDLEGVVDVIWVSGSPNLQTPYLLTVCSVLVDSLPLFTHPSSNPNSSHTIFSLIDKLDFAFSSLLTGRDPDTNTPLPGFEDGRSVSSTERVRIKSTVERVRVVVLRALDNEGEDGDDGDGMREVSEGSGEEADDEDEDMEEIDGMMGGGKEREDETVQFEGFDNTEDEEGEGDGGGDSRRQFGRVFERTLIELGDPIGEPIGIVTGN